MALLVESLLQIQRILEDNKMPVFNFDQSGFPLLTPQQTSPLGGVLSDAIAKRLAMAQTEKAEKEVPYAGLSSLAKILSESAYANAVTPQFALKAAEDPKIWANLTRAQQDKVIQQGALLAGGGGANPIMQHALDIFKQQNTPQPAGEGLLSGIRQLLGGGNVAQSNQSVAPEQQTITPEQQNAALAQGNVAPSSNIPVLPTSRGELPPAVANEMTYKRLTNENEAVGSEQGKQYADVNKQATQQGLMAQQLANNLEDFHDLYKKSWAKGVLNKSLLQKLDPNNQSGQNVQNIMATNVASILFPEGSTNLAKEQAANTKLTFDMSPKAEQEAYERLSAGAKRAKAIQPFYSEMRTMGITDPNQMQQYWYDYNEAQPYYDHDKHKPIWNNITLDRRNIKKFIYDDMNGKIKFPEEEAPKKEQAAASSGNWSHLSDAELEKYAK